jgi:hypothetical protein
VTIVFSFDEKIVTEIIMIWRPDKGDLIAVAGEVFKIADMPFIYDADIAKWEVQLERP